MTRKAGNAGFETERDYINAKAQALI